MAEADPPLRIDAHQHFWALARGDYGWLTPSLEPIHRDFGPADLLPHLRRHGIDATILVQAAPTAAETAYLLSVAADTAFIAGVVGWVDLAAPDAVAQIARSAGDALLVGIRPMVQDIADDDWLLWDELVPGFAALARLGLVFDALVLPRHLPRLLRVVDRHPTLTFVIDHLAKPPVAQGALAPWADDIAALARRPNVTCKLSGLLTEAVPDWTADDLRPYAEHVLACFGPDRVLWGSDWPVVNLAGGTMPGGRRPRRCWPGCRRATRPRSWAATRGASICGKGDGRHAEIDRPRAVA
jgi:L-fuconolactonase